MNHHFQYQLTFSAMQRQGKNLKSSASIFGWSISYRRVLEIEQTITRQFCEFCNKEDITCPPSLKKRKQCLKEMIASMFPSKNTHSARWMSVFMEDLLKLPFMYKNIYQFFSKCYVILKKRKTKFSNIGTDQAYEQHCTKIKFSIKDFFSTCDQLRSFLRIWSHLLKKSLMENFIFCAVQNNRLMVAR